MKRGCLMSTSLFMSVSTAPFREGQFRALTAATRQFHSTSMRRFAEKLHQQPAGSEYGSNLSSGAFKWVTDDDMRLSHHRVLEIGGFGEVHEVHSARQ